MKSATRTLVFTAAATLSSVTLAHAQFVDPMRFTTSFDFTVGRTRLPAGTYEIRRDEDNPSVYRIEARNRRAGTFFTVEPASLPKAPDRSEIVFAREGEGYALDAVWEEGSTDGVESVAAEAWKQRVKHDGVLSEARVPAERVARTAD